MQEVARLGPDYGIFNGRIKNLEFDIIGNGGVINYKYIYIFSKIRIIHVHYKTWENPN